MKDSYTKYIDPGHGWLEVPVEDLRELGVADKISPYSYLSADLQRAFLEEDCDMYVFMEAYKARATDGQYPPYFCQHTPRDTECFVRSLRPYSALLLTGTAWQQPV